MIIDFEDDISNALRIVQAGGIILYPTDTIWGIGCDATNSAAIKKIFRLKQRDDQKTMLVLVDDLKSIKDYVERPPDVEIMKKYLAKPTTIIYEKGKCVAPELLSADKSIGIRVVLDKFCKMLISRFGKPIVSTSANVSGSKPPAIFHDISIDIKKGVDYKVQHRQNDITPAKPSSILKITTDGMVEIIRQ